MGIQEIILILVTGLVATAGETFIGIKYFVSKKEYKKIKSELKDIKKRLENIDIKEKDSISDSKLEKVVRDVEVNRQKVQAVVLKLEQYIENSGAEITDAEIKQELKKLRSDADEVQQKISALENLANSYGGYQKLEQAIRMLTDAAQIHKNKIEEQQNEIISLRRENQKLYAEVEKLRKNQSVPEKIQKSEPVPETLVSETAPDIPESIPEPVPEIKGITIDEEYISGIAESLEDIKDVISSYDYTQFKKVLADIIDEDDYDDAGDIMCRVNSAMQRHIYDMSKVSIDDFVQIKAFVEKAGYSQAEVKAGDSIMHNSKYFVYMGGSSKYTDPALKGTICKIDVEPYVLVYSDNGANEEAVLQGECICYK